MKKLVSIQKFVFVIGVVALVTLLFAEVVSAAGAPIVSKDFKVRAAEGVLPLHELVYRTAYVEATDSAAVAYPPPGLPHDGFPWRDTAGSVTVSSSDAGDIGYGLRITYLDSDWSVQDTLAVTNGQTGVEYGILALDVLKAEVISGPPTSHIGSIFVSYDATLTAGVPDSNVQAEIPAGSGESTGAFYSVPIDKAFCVTGIILGCSPSATTAVRGALWAKPFGSPWRRVAQIENAGDAMPSDFFRLMPPKTRIALTVQTPTGTQRVAAGFVGHLKEVE